MSSNEGAGDRTARDQPRSKRSQVSKACPRCRRLQKGCSEYRPCERCVKVGLEDECRLSLGRQHRGRGLFDTDVSWSFTRLPTSPNDATHALPGVFQRRLDLLPPELLDHCCEQFFDRLYPTIPILTPEYISGLRAASHDGDIEAHCVLTAVCGMVLLQVEQADAPVLDGGIPDINSTHGQLVFEEALSAHHSLSRVSNPTLEYILASFFLYACHAALFHHSQAFLYLREATTLFLLKLANSGATPGLLADRLFWVLLVSERSHAIRYRRPITLHITTSSPAFVGDDALGGLSRLVQLFRPLDTVFIALLNQEETDFRPTAASISAIEASVNNVDCFSSDLHETQKANLGITQLWLRVIIWQVRLRLGMLSEESVTHGLTFHYPLTVAKELIQTANELSLDSIKVHGVGLTEKLFDVACAVVDVLARVPIGLLYQLSFAAESEENLRYLHRLISQLPGGRGIYISLLNKHIQQTLPHFTRS